MRFYKSKVELRAYKMPLTKIIEENTLLDLQEIEERMFGLALDETEIWMMEDNELLELALGAMGA